MAMCQFVPNFISYVSAKYFNLFTVRKVITKTERMNLLLRHSVVVMAPTSVVLWQRLRVAYGVTLDFLGENRD